MPSLPIPLLSLPPRFRSFLAYWLDSESGQLFAYDQLMSDDADLNGALAALERDFAPRLSEPKPNLQGLGGWQPATAEALHAIMHLPGESTSRGPIAVTYADCPPWGCEQRMGHFVPPGAVHWSSPPPPFESTFDGVLDGVTYAVNCCGGGGGPPPPPPPECWGSEDNTPCVGGGDPCTYYHCINGSCVGVPLCVDGLTCCDTSIGIRCCEVCCEGSHCCRAEETCCGESGCCVDNGDPCTVPDCIDGECEYLPISCDDNNECTTDSCDPQTGCVNEEGACETECCLSSLDGPYCCEPPTEVCCLRLDHCCLSSQTCCGPECCEPDEDCCDAKDCCDLTETCFHGRCCVDPDENDIDCDGIPNEDDPDTDNDGIPNEEDDDIDGDGIPDVDDEDDDDDSIPDVDDPTPGGCDGACCGRADMQPCTDDGLSCTTDICIGGLCEHIVDPQAVPDPCTCYPCMCPPSAAAEPEGPFDEFLFGYDPVNPYPSCCPSEKVIAVWIAGVNGALAANEHKNDALTLAPSVFPPPAGASCHNNTCDAFRHCYWACTMTRDSLLGPTITKMLVDLHEDCGDAGTPPQPAAERTMDDHNNAWGVHHGQGATSDLQCRTRCEQSANAGDLVVVLGGTGNPPPQP